MHKRSYSLLLPLAVLLVKGAASASSQASKTEEFVLSLYQKGHTAPTSVAARAKQ